MISLIIYRKDHKRKPVRFEFHSLFRDVQADIPTAWCNRCGSEVFDDGQEHCIRCRKAKGENDHE